MPDRPRPDDVDTEPARVRDRTAPDGDPGRARAPDDPEVEAEARRAERVAGDSDEPEPVDPAGWDADEAIARTDGPTDDRADEVAGDSSRGPDADSRDGDAPTRELSADVSALDLGAPDSAAAFDDASSVVDDDLEDAGVAPSPADGGDQHDLDRAHADLPDDLDDVIEPPA